MPHRKKVVSLKFLCIYNICNNIDSFWYEKYWKDIYKSPERLKSEVGPFEGLPACLLIEIVERLNKKPPALVTSLITSSLTNLDLMEVVRGPVPLDFISFKCKHTLKDLALSNCTFDNKALMKAIESFRKLEVLSLEATDIDDHVLAAVGSNCAELRKLNVNKCWNIEDKSMEHLFVSESSEGGINSYGKCKQLEILNIDGTSVSVCGVKTVLRNAPKLQNLDHPNVLHGLWQMHRNYLKADSPLIQYSLTSLRAGGDFQRKCSLKNALSIASRVCPHVTDVILHFESNIEEKDVLSPLCQLKDLKILNIQCSSWESSGVFSSTVAPVLSAIGQSITRLHLTRFPGVDVGIIGVCCPLLETFFLNTINGHTVAQPRKEQFIPPASNKRSFALLKFLFVSNTSSFRRGRWEHFDITPSQWKEMLSSRHLEAITILGFSSVTESLLSEVLKAGQDFPNLTDVYLKRCSNITAGFVQSFLELPNPLKKIYIERCENISYSDFDSFESYCKMNGLELCMHYYN